MQKIGLKYSVVAAVMILLIGAFILNRLTPSVQAELPTYQDDVHEPSEAISFIYVDIKGAIAHPGVYKVPQSTRLFQVIRLAGGTTTLADTTKINLSTIVIDQTMVYIPFIGEDLDQKDDNDQEDVKVSINTASHSQLVTLPNVGPATATAIINYREDHGPFTSLEHIMRVSGIGQATFDAIQPFITL